MAETEPTRTYPSDLPVLALRQTVVFPQTLQPLAINRPVSIESINRALAGDRLLFLSLQTGDREDPEPGDLRPVGTIAAIRQMAKAPNGASTSSREGTQRGKAEAITRSGAAMIATVGLLLEKPRRRRIDAYVRRIQELVDRARARAGSPGTARAHGPHDPLRLAHAGQPDRHQARGQAAILEMTMWSPSSRACPRPQREVALLSSKAKSKLLPSRR